MGRPGSEPHMTSFEFLGAFEPVGKAIVLTVVAVLWTVLLVRIVGLRAFSKMTSFDFVATIATGSLIAQAGTRSDWGEYAQALFAIGGVFAVQWLLAHARQTSKIVRALIKNEPLLLMKNGQFLEEAMSQSRVSRANVIEKLRAADVRSLDVVRAVVLETTGDISVLTGDATDERLLEGVRRA